MMQAVSNFGADVKAPVHMLAVRHAPVKSNLPYIWHCPHIHSRMSTWK